LSVGTQKDRGVENRLPDPGAGFIWRTEEPLALVPQAIGAACAYTTRRNGTSEGVLSSLNLSFKAEKIKQVHEAEVIRAPGPGNRPAADGQWTDDPGDTLAVVSADCVLCLFIGGKKGDGKIAVAHAGWRGVVAGVVSNAARSIGAHTVYLGPAIGPCCFEVGPEVVEAFRENFGSSVSSDERHLDLWSAAASAAKRVGVGEVFIARLCTSCHEDLFFSHRRDKGSTGRQALVARLA
jgi:polyphenol oxidase